MSPFHPMLQALRRGLGRAKGGGPGAATPIPDFSLHLHDLRSALLRQVPKGANTFLSAGCSGLWFFEWIERCYGRAPLHIGLEFYLPKPDNLPNNVRWIENTCSDMTGVETASCDLVFSGQNLEHLWPDEVVGFMLEAARVTREGGLLVIDSPNRNITEGLRSWSHPEHTVEFTTAEAAKLLELAGFDVTAKKGIWLCRDPETKEIFPFPVVPVNGWSVNERTVVGLEMPDEAFIWWLEARRGQRQPDREGVTALAQSVFSKAWPERIGRMSSQVGVLQDRGGTEWITAARGVRGSLVFGPYMPLKAGRYACVFHLDAEVDGDDEVMLCEVVLQRLSEPLVSRRSPVARRGTTVRLEFELDRLEFGVQFRCSTFGIKTVSCRRRVDLEENVPGP